MELAAAARDEAAFAMRVLRQLACGGGEASGSNLAVSPLSIHAALTLLGAGAKGATLDQIVAFLGPAGGPAHAALASHVALRVLSDSAGDGGGGPNVRFANGVWVDAAMRLKAGYAAVVSDHYRSQARPASFKAMVSRPSPPLSIAAAFAQEFVRRNALLQPLTMNFLRVLTPELLDGCSPRKREPRSTSGSRA
jgi:serine protease inhibitor